MAEWHINADEIPLFDYNDDARTADEAAFEEESDVLPLYAPDAFRTSDHDPILIGLDLAAPPAITSLTLPTAPVVKGASGLAAGDVHRHQRRRHARSLDRLGRRHGPGRGSGDEPDRARSRTRTPRRASTP